jgi:hypothetical protein
MPGTGGWLRRTLYRYLPGRHFFFPIRSCVCVRDSSIVNFSHLWRETTASSRPVKLSSSASRHRRARGRTRRFPVALGRRCHCQGISASTCDVSLPPPSHPAIRFRVSAAHGLDASLPHASFCCCPWIHRARGPVRGVAAAPLVSFASLLLFWDLSEGRGEGTLSVSVRGWPKAPRQLTLSAGRPPSMSPTG